MSDERANKDGRHLGQANLGHKGIRQFGEDSEWYMLAPSGPGKLSRLRRGPGGQTTEL